jgi:hypothetical protein
MVLRHVENGVESRNNLTGKKKGRDEISVQTEATAVGDRGSTSSFWWR